ncbi:NAD-dependent succinate-semialdehyde dehydrogenase [Thalassobacillus devorans]|uniref:NAD-dependent succinate-semialdehyde dehydrogenase n=1 Tax=Thalassobacillus devorans TaxID=279813 RepID=UPI00048D9425|nr:NAD-dependent succinate-semialdehyde dehydrogenase [Thalassobacillus devorans]
MVTFEDYLPSIYINGRWKSAASRKKTPVRNPATWDILTHVSYGDHVDTRLAIEAASEAKERWASLSPRKRSTILYRAYQMMEESADRIAAILTMEQGKPLREAKGEIRSAASFLLWYAEEANRLYGEWIPSSIESKRLSVIPQPVGVVGAITPWNFPASMITRKVAPALAAGCTVVLKPASETPLTAIEIVKILEKAGIPDGVVNLVTGNSAKIGDALLHHEAVRLITFTGSTEVGKHLMRESADQVKKLSLELGGHAPIIIFADADLEKAAEMTLASKFRNSGQTCICANRVYVEDKIWDDFKRVLVEKVEAMRLGDGLADEVDMGPLINEGATEKVHEQVKDAIAKGAEIACGGNIWEGTNRGHYYLPTILSDVRNDMLVMKEETFGPILPLQSFTSEEEAITAANDSEYGLAAYFFTKNLDRSVRVAEKLDYGIIGINDVFPAAAEAPFGGIKQSGIGKEGGHHGIHEYVELKYISMGIEN